MKVLSAQGGSTSGRKDGDWVEVDAEKEVIKKL
jgi:hypothetical protein